MPNITTREREAILQSLAAGVVPAIGLQHIQVGRLDEVSTVVKDLDHIEQDAASVRFIVGRYGSGKTFFLNLVRNVALQRRFVVIEADITTDRRLHGTGGKAQAFYSELMRNLCTRSKPEGGALANLVERWASDIDHRIRSAGGNDEDVTGEFAKVLRPLQEFVAGFDFAAVLAKYYEGFLRHDQALQDAALRWLRGEYSTKTEARKDLGVRNIIDDDSWYDYTKLLAAFCRIAGYAGLVVNVDELVVLSHRLSNTTARNNNYEAVLRIINDCLGGRASGIGFLFAGTPDCLEDRRRGLYSYEALATRLASNSFASQGLKDFTSPVIRLENLAPEDCFVLLSNIRKVHALDDPNKQLIPDEGIVAFLEFCHQRIGAAYFQTPRETVKSFVGLLRVLEQNPDKKWMDLLTADAAPSQAEADPTAQIAAETDADLAEFKL
ncbi:MAG: ATP-binding protein [Pirellulales bacterium]